jgi:hypothetical protein
MLLLLAAPVLLVAGCTASSHSTATPTTAPAAPASASAGPASNGSPSGPATTGSPSGPATTGSPTATKGTGGATRTATPRCHTGDLKLTLGKGGTAPNTKFRPLFFTNVADHACTLHGYPGVSWVAGNDGHQVGDAFNREGFNPTVTLAPGEVAYATLTTHDVGMFPASQCKPVSVRGYRVYPPDETKPVFVASATKACSAKGVNVGNVAAILIHPMD